jgi:hypothetical protein
LFRFTLRDMFWLIWLVAVAISWWRDHGRLQAEKRAMETQMYSANGSAAAANYHRDQMQHTLRMKQPHYIADGWLAFADPSKYDFLLDADIRHAGVFSASIKNKARPDNSSPQPIVGFASLSQSIRADTYRGQRLSISCYARIVGEEPRTRYDENCWLWVTFDESPRDIPKGPIAEVSIGRTPVWKQYAVIVQVPANATTIVFGIDFLERGGSQGWFDDFQITVLDDADMQPVTLPSYRYFGDNRTPGQPKTPYLQPTAENLDFETAAAPNAYNLEVEK